MARMTQQGSVKAKTPHPPPVPENPGLSLNNHQVWDLGLLEPDFLCNVTEDFFFFLTSFLTSPYAVSKWKELFENQWKKKGGIGKYTQLHLETSMSFNFCTFGPIALFYDGLGSQIPVVCQIQGWVRVSKRYLLVGGRNEKWPISPVIRKQTEYRSLGEDWAGARQAISVAKWAVCRHRVLSRHCERHRARSRDTWPFPSTGMESNDSCRSDHRVRWNRHWNQSTPEAKEGTACQSVLGTTGCPQSSFKTDFFQVSLILELSNLSVAEGD